MISDERAAFQQWRLLLRAASWWWWLPQFEKEFNDDLWVIAHAIKRYGLPDTLKLNVHSGSDKFLIYPAINRALREHGCGVHVKTADTTWLEEIIGLAEHGGEGVEAGAGDLRRGPGAH